LVGNDCLIGIHADHRSRIVFITRGIDRADLDASFLDHIVASRKFDASVRA